MIKTFFWNDRIRSSIGFFVRRRLLNHAWNDFLYGNAGDIFARDVVSRYYPEERQILCQKELGPKLLTVGSIAHCARGGDVIFGSGSKFETFQGDSAVRPYVHSLRGPLSYDVLKKAGWDVSTVDHLADPGLLIGDMVDTVPPIPNKIIFIPHYRERRSAYGNMPVGIEYVDIDDEPENIARKIMEAELVYSSSLHGVIFAHSLGRPVVPVAPATQEPKFKYDDYYLSMDLEPPTFLDSIHHAKTAAKPTSPASIPFNADQITPPSIELLLSRGVVTR